jgi:hypothetical protein
VYKPENETPTRQNKDVSATYFIGPVNCYDSLTTGVPILWNSKYTDELIFPNPSDKGVQIEFGLAVSEQCELEILDPTGKRITTLLGRSPVPAGRFTVFWDGKDAVGRKLQAGMYSYLLTKEKSGISTGKIILK